MSKDNSLWIVGAVIAVFAVFALMSSNNLFSTVNFNIDQVQYYNQPIKVTVNTDIQEPVISAYFNNVPINMTQANSNGTYILSTTVSQEGILKVSVDDKVSNQTFEQVVEVRKPYVSVTNDFPATTDKGKSIKLTVKTYTPQGQQLVADGVDVDVIYPDGSKQTIFLEKSGNEFTKNFAFTSAGNHNFKIHARKDGFDTVEKGVIVEVLRSSSAPAIVYIWAGLIVLWLVLFALRRYQKWRRR